MPYEEFRNRIAATIRAAGRPLTWTEIRTEAKLPQTLPNNKWVRQMEADMGLIRTKDTHGIMHWHVNATS